MKKIIIISFTDLAKDPRVNRQIRFLKNSFDITAVGTADPKIPGVKFVDCGRTIRTRSEKIRDIFKLLGGRFENYYWSAYHIKNCKDMLSGMVVDLVIANDIESLPLAVSIAGNAKIIFDAHEFAPREFEDLLIWRILYKKYKIYLCNNYIHRPDAMMTVCRGIAEEYEREFGKEAIVLTNAPAFVDIQPHNTNGNHIRMVYHGGANSSRKIENMIKMMEYVDDRFSLDLILIGQERYIKWLRELAADNKKIRFLSPVPMEDICTFISQYDIGIYLLEPNSFNNRMALPNKFFEFIQARLAIAIAPSPQMESIVREYECGIIAEDFLPISLAKAINSLNADKIDYFKENSAKLAHIMCAEKNSEIVNSMVKNLIG